MGDDKRHDKDRAAERFEKKEKKDDSGRKSGAKDKKEDGQQYEEIDNAYRRDPIGIGKPKGSKQEDKHDHLEQKKREHNEKFAPPDRSAPPKTPPPATAPPTPAPEIDPAAEREALKEGLKKGIEEAEKVKPPERKSEIRRDKLDDTMRLPGKLDEANQMAKELEKGAKDAGKKLIDRINPFNRSLF